MKCNRSAFLTVLSILLVLANATAERKIPCDPRSNLSNFTFCNVKLSAWGRAADLVSRLSLREKVRQLVDSSSGIERLGVPPYEWWSEALHGVSDVGSGTFFSGSVPGATVFPQVIHSASTFNATLWEAIGQVVSTEARAMYNMGQAGLTFWSPNVNVFRDPRWGRGQETPGEDPYLIGKYAAAYVRGLQDAGGAPGALKVAACCKHYTAYDVDNWKGTSRYTFNADVTLQDLVDTYDPPFKACITDGHVAAVMCSYNQVNGIPTCADPKLLKETVRGQWNLDGYISSDCDSIETFFSQQNFVKTAEEAAAVSLNAGVNLNCGTFLAEHTEAAVKAGKVNESTVDQALTYNYATLMRLGWFNGAGQTFADLSAKDVCRGDHRSLSLDAARQGIVLLQSNQGILPFKPDNHQTVAVIGPNANVTATMIGNYAGKPCGYVSPLEGISLYARAVYAEGCNGVLCPKDDLIADATAVAANAESTVLIVGGDLSLEAELLDRTSLLLPGFQPHLVSAVAAASRGPVVLVIMSGGPFDISFALNSSKISGILWVGYPGELGGQAIADVIFGAYNPGGKLPMTWYPEEYTQTPMTDMRMRPDSAKGYPGRTYRFYTGKTLFEFGFGLSYSEFRHSIVSVSVGSGEGASSAVIKGGASVSVGLKAGKCENVQMEVTVAVKNAGKIDGAETVMIFAVPPATPGAPRKQLVDFGKVWVKAGSNAELKLNFDACARLGIVDAEGVLRLNVGNYSLLVGEQDIIVQVRFL